VDIENYVTPNKLKALPTHPHTLLEGKAEESFGEPLKTIQIFIPAPPSLGMFSLVQKPPPP
jgi:hypothetical protein